MQRGVTGFAWRATDKALPTEALNGELSNTSEYHAASGSKCSGDVCGFKSCTASKTKRSIHPSLNTSVGGKRAKAVSSLDLSMRISRSGIIGPNVAEAS
jgi:hypothetical protein